VRLGPALYTCIDISILHRCVLFLLCFLSHKHTKYQELEVRQHVDLLLCVCGSSRRLIKSVFFFRHVVLAGDSDSALIVLNFLSWGSWSILLISILIYHDALMLSIAFRKKYYNQAVKIWQNSCVVIESANFAKFFIFPCPTYICTNVL